MRFAGEASPASAVHATRLDGAPTHLIVEWDMLRRATDFAATNVFGLTWEQGELVCQVGVMLTESPPRTQFFHQYYDPANGDSTALGDATTDLTLDTTLDTWLHLSLEVTLSPGASSIVLTGVGGEARRDPVLQSDCELPPKDGTVKIQLGPTYNDSALEVFYDNVVVRTDSAN